MNKEDVRKLKIELKIYEQMLKAFRKQYWLGWPEYNGFCSYINRNAWMLFDWPPEIKDLDDLSVLNKFKPKGVSFGYWYYPGKMRTRIKILKQAIKFCKQKIREYELDTETI